MKSKKLKYCSMDLKEGMERNGKQRLFGYLGKMAVN